MSNLSKNEWEIVFQYIREKSQFTHYGTTWSDFELDNGFYSAKFYAKCSSSIKGGFLEKLKEEDWDYAFKYIQEENQFKKYTFKLAQSYLIEQIMSGYINNEFNELNPKTLKVFPCIENNVLNIHFEIQTFPFNDTTVI
jgi:hypothetical protein